jgi:hypothetical protein
MIQLPSRPPFSPSPNLPSASAFSTSKETKDVKTFSSVSNGTKLSQPDPREHIQKITLTVTFCYLKKLLQLKFFTVSLFRIRVWLLTFDKATNMMLRFLDSFALFPAIAFFSPPERLCKFGDCSRIWSDSEQIQQIKRREV